MNRPSTRRTSAKPQATRRRRLGRRGSGREDAAQHTALTHDAVQQAAKESATAFAARVQDNVGKTDFAARNARLQEPLQRPSLARKISLLASLFAILQERVATVHPSELGRHAIELLRP